MAVGMYNPQANTGYSFNNEVLRRTFIWLKLSGGHRWQTQPKEEDSKTTFHIQWQYTEHIASMISRLLPIVPTLQNDPVGVFLR
jgi:hypothetical protein